MADTTAALWVSQAFEQLRSEGYRITEDRWQRIKTDFFAGKVDRKLSAQELHRLRLILFIESKIDKEKVRHSEIAFWLAFHGESWVPATLVAEHLERSVEGFTAYIRQLVRRLGTGRTSPEHIRRERAESLGALIGRKAVALTEVQNPAKLSFLTQIFSIIANAAIGFVFFAGKLWFLERPLQKLCEVLFPTAESAKEIQPIVYDLFETLRTYLRRPQDGFNALTDSIRKANAREPFEIVRSCRRAHIMILGFGQVFPLFSNPEARLSPAAFKYFRSMFPPIMSAVTLACRDHPYAHKLFAQIDVGEPELYSQDMNRLRDIRYVLNTRFGDEHVEHTIVESDEAITDGST